MASLYVCACERERGKEGVCVCVFSFWHCLDAELWFRRPDAGQRSEVLIWRLLRLMVLRAAVSAGLMVLQLRMHCTLHGRSAKVFLGSGLCKELFDR